MIRPLSILYEDPFCLAVIKPAGQFTQGTWAPPGEETLEQGVRRHLNPDNPAEAYVGILHRLDRPVSGLLLWAKTQKAARRLSKQFENRQVRKTYWAIVERTSPKSPSQAECWEDWLTAAGPDGKVRVMPANTPNARRARTDVRLLSSDRLPESNLGWLEMRPETGRTHQLRVQAAIRGMPILGDTIYGSTRPWPFPQGIALHARELQIRHPADQSSLVLKAPLPETWREFGFVEIERDDTLRAD